MTKELNDIAVIKDNINNSSLDEEVKTDLLNQLQSLEINVRMDQALEDVFIKSHITSDAYLVRKKLLITERVTIQNNIDSDFSKNILKKLGDKDEGLFIKLRKAIKDNVEWISILLTLSQIILTL